jgi:hypothetical protein
MVRHEALLIPIFVVVSGCGGALVAPDGGGHGDDASIELSVGGGDLVPPPLDAPIGWDAGPPDGNGCTTGVPALPVQPIPGASCTYALPTPPPCDYFNNGSIAVFVNGAQVPRDVSHANGWDYSDATFTAFTIYGPLCDAVDAGAANVTIVYRILI